MLAEKNIYIQSAYKTLQVISQDDQKRMEYEAREKAIRDYNQGLLEAEERGWSAGEKAGVEKGRIEEKESTAKNMLAIGLPIDIIIQSTGLSREKIDQLSKGGQTS